MKKQLLLFMAVIMMVLSYAQNTWAKCETIINTPTTICVGDKYDLSITDFPCDCINFDKVNWVITDPGGTTTITAGSPYTYAFTMVGTYKVCVKWYDMCTGESFFVCREVIVKDCGCETKIDIPTSICLGKKYDLSLSNPCDCIKPDAVKWQITDPGGATMWYGGTPLTYAFSMPGVYKVCVYWHDYCTGKDEVYCQDVVVKECGCETKIDIPKEICSGTKYDLALINPCDCISPDGVKWQITDPFGTVTSYGGNPLSFVFSTPGIYKVCVKWHDYCTGKDNVYCQDVFVKDCCHIVYDIPTVLCAGEKVSLAIKEDCDCIHYDEVKWQITDPGGTTTGYSGVPIFYVFSTPGVYKVCVYWHDYCTGKDNIHCQDVIVKNCCKPVINIPTEICAGTKYTMSIKDDCDCIDYTSIKWVVTDPGGISTSFGGNPLTYLFTTVGVYKVCVYWHDNCTGKDNVYCQDVNVKNCCKPIINIPTEICAGTKYTMSIKDDCDCIDYTSIKWVITNPGGISTSYGGNPLTYLFSTVGIYKVCVYWHDKCTGKDNVYCQDVNVKNCCKPVIDIPTELCVGTKYDLSIKDDCDCIDYSSIKWEITTPGGVTTGYGGNPLTYIFSSVGVYKVCVYWYDHCTGKNNSYCQNITVKECCPTKIDIPTEICSGEKYNLQILNECGCIKYGLVKWEITTPGGTTTSYSGSPLSYVFTTPGIYKVCVYWTDYCTGKDNVYCQDVKVKDCCPTKIDIPTSICAGEKYNLQVINDCGCIYPDEVKWEITEPGGGTSGYGGNPLSYVFSTVGTYKVCVYWYNHCTGEKGTYCQDVVVKNCSCICDMKISKNSATTDFGSGYILNNFHLNSGSKKVVGVDISIPFFNYNWEESGCKFHCEDLNTGYTLGNIVKYSPINDYFPTAAGCHDEWWAREQDWHFPTPQVIDQDIQIVISVPPTDCKMLYTYCVKVLLHYDDCTVCECTFCFRGDEVTCTCEPSGEKPEGKMGKTGGLSDDDVNVYPNPNDGTFTVKMAPTTSTKVISVMDMTGKTLLRTVAVGEKTDLEMNNIAAGTYMVVVTGDGKTVSKRVVIANTK